MFRVLVPLDGSRLAEAILPDACEIAGREGEIALLHVIPSSTQDHGTDGFSGRTPVMGSERYLQSLAARLTEQGMRVTQHSELRADISDAIDVAAETYEANLIACATHGRGPAGRMVHGGVVWKAVVHSTVPLLVKHVTEGAPPTRVPRSGRHHILVAVDGSRYAEKALPLAERLARGWNAMVTLVRVVNPMGDTWAQVDGSLQELESRISEARGYLERLSGQFPGETTLSTPVGQVPDCLTEVARDLFVDVVVMATRARVGLPRIMLGSVADHLIQELACPVLVIPPLAAGRLEEATTARDGVATHGRK